jgi:hypothetical protein
MNIVLIEMANLDKYKIYNNSLTVGLIFFFIASGAFIGFFNNN